MKIVLAYSGGLDTSVIVKWLRETYDAEIVTFAADIGQEEELKGLPKRPAGPAPPSTTPSTWSRSSPGTSSTR
jgi:argininosuccinate synthase